MYDVHIYCWFSLNCKHSEKQHHKSNLDSFIWHINTKHGHFSISCLIANVVSRALSAPPLLPTGIVERRECKKRAPRTDHLTTDLNNLTVGRTNYSILDLQLINAVTYFSYVKGIFHKGIFQGSLKGTAAAENCLFNYSTERRLKMIMKN